MPYHFCTYFDSHYLIRGLALYRSLSNQIENLNFYVVCLDEDTHKILKSINIANIIPIPLRNVEEDDPALLEAKSNRSLVEYYFTLSPVVPLYVLNHFPDVDRIAYLDADLYFYSDPKPIYDEMGEASILIAEHRFPRQLKCREKFGRFNIQCQIFKRDEDGFGCLRWWREKCIQWCCDRLEDGKFADQKYLDEWPRLFKNLVILQHKGAGLAPWNWMQYDIKIDETKNQATIDGEKLIFYHFHGLKMIDKHLIFHGLNYYDATMPKYIKQWLYGGYMRQLRDVDSWLRNAAGCKTHLAYTDQRSGRSRIRSILSGIKNRQLMWV